jgi:hypothetical protein
VNIPIWTEQNEGLSVSAQQYHLAHLNIGKARAPLFDPLMAGFVEKLDEINNLAYQSPGFVWHLQIDIHNPEHLAMYGEPGTIFNLSVWDSVEALYTYVYRSQHAQMMKSRNDWFGEMEGPHYALWWLPADELPTLEDGKQRIAHLAAHGSTAHSFSFKNPFPNPALPSRQEESEAGAMLLRPQPPAWVAERLHQATEQTIEKESRL